MTYAYFCPECGSEKEDWHPMSEDPKIMCDECNITMKHKVTGGVATLFRGFGWNTVGSKDGTQGHHKPVSQMEMAVPVAAGGSNIVTDEAKKVASDVRVEKI